MRFKAAVNFENILSVFESLTIRLFTSTAFQIYFNTLEKRTLTISHVRIEWWLNATTQISLRFSECLNPIFYNLASRYLHFLDQD